MSRLMKDIKAVHVMARANFDSWMHSPRTWIMLLFVISFCYMVCNGHVRMLRAQQFQVHWDETLFYILFNGCNITSTSILFLVTISELPRRMGYQYNMLIRSTRSQWLVSQILYCLWMTLCMLALVTLCVSLFILPGVVAGSGWTDDLRIAQEVITADEALVPAFIRNNFSPFAACLCALLPMFLFWITMVFIVFLCSLFGAPLVGVLAYALMLIGNVVFMVEAMGNIQMPIYYATLSNITAGWVDEEFKKVAQALVGYAIVIFMLLVAMFIRAKRADLEFNTEQRL